MIKNTPGRPTESESQAQSSRPRPLATEMIPTILAATRGGTPLISPAIGAACEIMLIPAVTFRKRTAQRAYHCQVDRARCRVKSRGASRACFFAEVWWFLGRLRSLVPEGSQLRDGDDRFEFRRFR